VRRRLAVLAYHAVPDADAFESQARFLARFMNPISGERAARAIQGSSNLPPRAVLVTFDDGDPTVLTKAAPILARRGIPAVAFVVTGVLGSDRPPWPQEVELLVGRGARVAELLAVPPDRYVHALKGFEDETRRRIVASLRRSIPQPVPAVSQLTAAEIDELRSAGIEIGNHTHGHPCLDRCDDETVESEIVTAHEILGRALPEPPRLFAYPNGNWDPRAARILRSLGYEAAFLFDHRMAKVPAGDPLRVSRLRISTSAPLGRLAAIASGIHATLYHLRYGR
jgi:peptidoglycan/xylan/chitin deacetylase (PgdA/CDA1 family)